MKKKILYIVSTLRVCGPVNQLFGIVSNLKKENYDFKILTLSPEPSNSKMSDFIDNRIKVESLNLSRLQFQMTGKKKLKQSIEEYKPDVIHTTGVRVDTTVSKLGFEDKQLMTIRNYVYDDYVSKFGKVIGTYFSKETLKTIEKVKYPVCCSYSLQDLYDPLVSNDLKVIQNGVDNQLFLPPKDQNHKLKLREKLNLPKDKTIFIAVGSLIKRKDPITMIKAFKQANVPNALMVFLGEGNLMEGCKDEANENVILKGNVQNVVDYLRASDTYVSASYSEGLPNSVLEAGRTGVSLILSDIPQHREVFMHGYEHPALFEAGNINQLSKEFEIKYKEASITIDFELSNYIDDHFSNQSMSENYQILYNQM